MFGIQCTHPTGSRFWMPTYECPLICGRTAALPGATRTGIVLYSVQRFNGDKGTNVKGMYRVYLEYTLADLVKSRLRTYVSGDHPTKRLCRHRSRRGRSHCIWRSQSRSQSGRQCCYGHGDARALAPLPLERQRPRASCACARRERVQQRAAGAGQSLGRRYGKKPKGTTGRPSETDRFRVLCLLL